MPTEPARRATLKQILDEGRTAARNAQKHVAERVRQAMDATTSLVTTERNLQQTGPEPPVVARLIVEIRSDGTRTIARGAMEDAATQERVAIKAEGTTPAQLAASLAKSIFTMPLVAAQAVRAMQRGNSASADDAANKSRQ